MCWTLQTIFNYIVKVSFLLDWQNTILWLISQPLKTATQPNKTQVEKDFSYTITYPPPPQTQCHLPPDLRKKNVKKKFCLYKYHLISVKLQNLKKEARQVRAVQYGGQPWQGKEIFMLICENDRSRKNIIK